ncbi:MAG: hypothetical protein KA368_02715 [Acidobacteria bacterium]|nr:hypothetical protein [Acidobacteriota bacterium]
MLSVVQKIITLYLVVIALSLMSSLSVSVIAKGDIGQGSKSLERERDRAYARQQFTKNFRDLQVTSQNLLKEHEEKRLTQKRLAKDIRIINKSAKALRSMMALGDLADPSKIDKEINTPQEFDKSIRRIAKLIYDFAHNPIHQNSKVFNTDQAQQAQTDLLAIIDLSKAIESKAKSYTVEAGAVQ